MKKTISRLVAMLTVVGIFTYCGGKKEEVPTPVVQEEASVGQVKFDEVCASCHGLSGEGDGPAGLALDPKPRNFVTEEFKFGDDLESIENTIRKGSEGTGMIGYEEMFADDELKALASYVLKLRTQGGK